MGCTAAVAAETQLKIPLPAEEVNSYIDQLPTLSLNKLKELYLSYTQKSHEVLTRHNFIEIYSPDKLLADQATKLFYFFSEGKETAITCKQFIIKYCILTYSQTPLFLKILFEIWKEANETATMGEIAYDNFVKTHAQYCETPVDVRHFPLTAEKFIDALTRSEFRAKEFQARLGLIGDAELPFAEISRELIDSDFNDLVSGSSYFLLSNKWYYRWSFYYQDVNHLLDRQNIKSTKMLVEEKLSLLKKKKKKETRETTSSSNSIGYKGEITTQVIEQPESIDFQDIEGQYREELKENLKISSQIKIVSERLWSLLCSLHSSEVSFKRIAVKKDTLDYYPKSIYFSEADQRGQIIIRSQVIKQISDSQRIGNLIAYSTQKKYIFYKLFNDQPWKETSFNKMAFQLSQEPRFFVVVTAHKDEFLTKNSRKQVSMENIALGDTVYAFLSLTNAVEEAIVFGVAINNRFKIHFKGFSYRHQVCITKEQIWLNQAEGISGCAMRKKETIVPILNNLMDDGILNVAMQCLIATPVLSDYLLSHHFDQINQPIAYCLSLFTKYLLQNQSVDIQHLKKMLTMNIALTNYGNIRALLQQILNRFNSELEEKLTIVDYLFKFDEKLVITCNECKHKDSHFENAHMLELHHPESSTNFYSVIVLPIAAASAKKVVIKMGVEDTVNDFLSQFEDAVCSNRKNYTFFLTNSSQSTLNNQITQFSNQRKKLIQLGFAPAISLYALEKIPLKLYFDLLTDKGANYPYKDYHVSSKNISTICKIIDSKEDKEHIIYEYLQSSGEHELVKIEKKKSDAIYQLGSKSSTISTNRKLIFRRCNSNLRQMMQFGVQLFVGVPIWASYSDIEILVKKNVRKMTKESDNPYQLGQKNNFFIRLQDQADKTCIFCQQIFNNFNLSQPSPCCNIYDKSIPLSWLTKSKSFEICVEWTNIQKVNISYFEQIQLDSLSKDILIASQEQQVTIDEYIKTYRQSLRLQAPCEKCQSNNQRLEREINQISNILILSLNDAFVNGSRKLGLRLKWPEYLDSSKISIKTKGRIYELFAAVRNTATSKGNFYTCSTKRRHPLKNKKNWFSFDDDVVHAESGEMKFIDDPCLLFFKKVDMPTSARVIFDP